MTTATKEPRLEITERAEQIKELASIISHLHRCYDRLSDSEQRKAVAITAALLDRDAAKLSEKDGAKYAWALYAASAHYFALAGDKKNGREVYETAKRLALEQRINLDNMFRDTKARLEAQA